MNEYGTEIVLKCPITPQILLWICGWAKLLHYWLPPLAFITFILASSQIFEILPIKLHPGFAFMELFMRFQLQIGIGGVVPANVEPWHPCRSSILNILHSDLSNQLYVFEGKSVIKLWSSGECQARISKGWPLRRKASKLKPEPRAYIKVGRHLPTTHPPGSLITPN